MKAQMWLEDCEHGQWEENTGRLRATKTQVTKLKWKPRRFLELHTSRSSSATTKCCQHCPWCDVYQSDLKKTILAEGQEKHSDGGNIYCVYTCTPGTWGLPETDLSLCGWAHFDFRDTTRFFKFDNPLRGSCFPRCYLFWSKPQIWWPFAVIMLFQTLHRTLHVFPVFIKFDNRLRGSCFPGCYVSWS